MKRFYCPVCKKPMFPRSDKRKKISLTRGFDCLYCKSTLFVNKEFLK